MLSTPFEFQIVLTPKPMHHTESTTLVLSLQKFPRTAVIKDQPSWAISVSNCIYETYDLGGYFASDPLNLTRFS